MKLRLASLAAFVLTTAACSRDLGLPDPPPVTGFVTGRVVTAVPGTSQSAPLPGATVTLLSSNLHATTDERGQFLLGPLPEGTYRLFFASKASGTTRQRLLTGVPLKPGATNSVGDVSIQENALLTGRALIQGRTSGNVGITIFAPGTDYVTTSADNGGWLLSNLPEGSIRASAWRPGFSPATTTDISLQGGVVTSAVDMILEPEDTSSPPGAILGRVRVLGHDDNAGVTVKAVSVQSQTVKATTTSDAEGHFTLSDLAPDLYTVTLELEGYPKARVPNLAVAGGVLLELAETIIMAVTGDGNVGKDEPIGGPSGPLFDLDGGLTSPDGGTVVTDGGTIGAECTDDNQCASGRLCVDNRCVGCSVNVQCRPGYSCHAGDCTRDCQSNEECSQGLACIGGSCVNCITSSDCRDPSLVCNPQAVCAHCRDRSECPAGKACLLTGCGTCTADADCGASSICEQGVCTAGDCHGNADCGATEACVGRNCGMCSADSQCRAGQLCISGACLTGNCRSVTECTAGQVCLNNQCGACANDSQCGSGQLCLPGAGGLRCTAATCRLNSDCTGAAAGQLCINNQCLPCGSANPCTNGQICNAQGRCVVGDCFTNLDCTGSKAGWACLAGNCTPCGVNSDCAASGYVCVSGICRVGNCVNAGDCAIPGQLCVNNACVGCATSSQCPAGQVCDSDSLCHPGNCITGADCALNQVCTARVCGACTQDSQCGVGKLCLGGTCTVANCRVPSDCAVAGQLCLANTCASCTSSTQCGSGQVCDVDGLCKAGNCVTNANCPGGRLCVARTCTDCTADSECGAGKICVTGGCVTGVCHGDADCSGGQQLCDTNPGSPTAYTCKPCAPLNTLSGNTCGTGRVCDAAGLCHFGNCFTNTNCGAQVCSNFNCVPCSQDTQCNSGQLCVNTQCKPGNCHGTGADPNVDCNATNGTCVNNVCVGNCRANTDCAATGYCDTNTHFCAQCTGPGQCGVGKVCSSGGSGNTCITAQCSNIEPNCQLGYSCVSGTCLQLGPQTTSFDGGYVEPGTFSGANNVSPMALSGTNTLYFSGFEQTSSTGAGTYSVALEPNLTVRWRVRDSTSSIVKNGFGGAGIVLPAPGFPNGELFLANDGNGGAIAHRSDNGSQVWRIPYQPSGFATGIVSGVPTVAWVSGNTTAYWMKTDGSGLKQLGLAGCANPYSIAFGTRAIYVVCGEAVYLVDPITSVVKTVPHNGNPANNNMQGTSVAGVTPVWRPPNNYTARGVNSGTVTSDLLVYMARGLGFDWLLAVNVPDDWVTNATPTSTWTAWSNSGVGLYVTPPAIDNTGAVYLTGQSRLYKVNVFNGQLLANVPLGTFGAYWNVAVNSQLIDVAGNTLQGFLLADGASTTPSPLWTLPATPGPYPYLFPTFQTTATNGGNLLAFQTNSSGQTTLQSMPPGPSAPAFVPAWPATSLGGDSGNHNTAPAYECTSNADCASTQNCLLGRCAGTCRDASQCGAGLGCNLGNCGACSTAASCRSGEVCWVGECIACSGPNCCSTNTDCAPGNFCQGGSCRQAPASGLPGAFSVANLISRYSNGNTTVAPDGTMYVGDTNASSQPFWKVVTPAGSVASTTPTIPFALGGAAQLPVVMVASNGSGNSLWYGAGLVLYSAPAASSVGAWTTATYNLFTTGFMRIGQGMSSAMTGSPRPTIFATANSAYGNQYLMAIDAATAAAGGTGNPGLLWAGLTSSTGGCVLSGVSNELDHLLIGSDGTVYVACPDGSVEAWAADGDPTTGPPPGRLGLMKWRSAPPPSWTTAMVGRPAIGKAPGGDVMYLPRPNAAGLAVLNLATASNGTVPLEVTVDASSGVLTDSSGRAIVMGGVYAKELSVVSPTGAISYDDKGNWYFSGHGAVLTAEGQLIVPEINGSNPIIARVSGISVANPSQVALLFSFVGAGGLAIDASTAPVVLSTSQVSTGLIAFDHVPLVTPGRTLTGYPFAGSQGPMPNAWSARNADQQRRNSLKTQ